jgi:catechol 2,3-dioxygenase-like lactoylglutathione lyase family enzyme
METSSTAQPAEQIQVQRLEHVAVVVTDVERARAFYVNVLGLREVARPKSFDFPGAWFQVGPEVLHLLGRPQTEGTGRRHFCLWVKDVHAAAKWVAGSGFPVLWEHTYKIEGIDRFFTADPDSNRIEIQGPEKSPMSK